MLQTSIKKLFICLVSLLIIVTCASCKADETYSKFDYLQYLVKESGIGEDVKDLINWKVIDEIDLDYLDEQLDGLFLNKTLSKLTDLDKQELSNKVILDNYKDNEKIDKEVAQQIVDRAIEYINNKVFDSTYEYVLNDNDNIKYDEESNTYYIYENDEYRQAEFNEVFSYLNISDTFEIDFTDAQIIPLNEEENTSYTNDKYNLLSTNNHVFNTDGFRVSYTLNSSGIDVHVSRQLDKSTVYADVALNKVKPSFKWTYESGDLKNCYFNVSMNSTEKLGASIGKYGRYYLDFKDLDGETFLAKLSSTIKPRSDEVEATIPICEIKTPIPNIPTATINLRLLVKLYISGRVELVLYNSSNMGFEVKDGNTRFFYNHNDDFDAIARASGKACLGVNIGIDATNYRLFDIELDGGLKALMSQTIHLYDSDGNMSSQESDIPYSILEEITQENPNVLVCGDLSFYWMFDLIINTSRTMMYKLGFTKTFHILNESNQVFGNLHHIENGVFVKKCTRKNKVTISSGNLNVNARDKITLNSYAEVLNIGQQFFIEIQSIPKDYTSSNIKYESLNSAVASIDGNVITAIKAGSAKIRVYTSDNKYSAYINILVSTG